MERLHVALGEKVGVVGRYVERWLHVDVKDTRPDVRRGGTVVGTGKGRVRWGADAESWACAKAEARSCLEACAREHQTISYSDLCLSVAAVRLRPYSWALMALLGEITSERDALLGVSLAALVVRRDTGMPGEGYFAQGGYPAASKAREAAWREDMRRVCEVYAGDGGDRDAVVR